jgi:hypothetical protein
MTKISELGEKLDETLLTPDSENFPEFGVDGVIGH